ncbi:MAG: hypothetical protein ACT4P7_15230 [Gemmatimonadaceae bacterium]
MSLGRRMLIGLWSLSFLSCHDPRQGIVISPGTNASVTVAALVVGRESGIDSLVTVSLRLNPGSAVGRLGSLTGSVGFDTLRLRFLGDATDSDGAVRAVHAKQGLVRIAALSTSGLVSPVVKLRFSVHDRAALATLVLQISELHTLDATDVRGSLVISPVAGTR